MSSKRCLIGLLVCLVSCAFFTVSTEAAVQYSNDFENPSSEDVQAAYPEWIKFAEGADCHAVNGRLEWYDSGGNDDWMRLDMALPQEYTVELDFFYQADVNGRFSFWPLCGENESIGDRHNYFMRANTHYYNLADTVPSEGPIDLTLPMGSNPHRLRFEVNGDHVIFLYKNKGEGGWVLIDERDFPAFDGDNRYIQMGYNHDGGDAGTHYVDNVLVSYREENIFHYSNNFDNPSSDVPWEAWPEWVEFGSVTAQSVNGRIEWLDGGNQWIRLDKELPMNFVMEFDFFHPENVNSRFSVWPLVKPGESIERRNYFLRENSHYYNLADTVPSEGPFNANLPIGSPPHRLRFEVTGDHVVFLYKDQGVGGWIKVDERDIDVPFGDDPRYVQLGNNLDSSPTDVHYIDNFEVTGLSENRAIVERAVGLANFEPNTAVPVSLQMRVTGNLPSLTIIEGIPEGWTVANISNGGVVSNGNVIWSFTNQSETVILTYDAMPPRLILERVASFSGSVDSGDGEERIAGDTAVAMLLPYLYRECIDYDFSGSPVDGKNYPTESAFGERYTQGMDGIPSDTVYERPGGGDLPAIDAEFVFSAGGDFHMTTGTGGRGSTYSFDDYRDQEEIVLQHGSSDTNADVGGDVLAQGDWLRYTFDLGESDEVLLVNLSINTWGGSGGGQVDLFVDNKFQGEFFAADTDFNAFAFYTVGPFEVSSGVHSIVLAMPGPNVPDGIGRMEVVKVKGIGRVERSLTADGFFDAGQDLTVSLSAEALYGSYSAFIDEVLPVGVEVTDLGGGELVGNHLLFNVDPTTNSQTVEYTITTPEGLKFLLFSGFCDIGLPLAESVHGDVSVTNEVWLFGSAIDEKTDNFDSDLADPWFVEYGSDPALSADYEDGVAISVADGKLTVESDTVSTPDKFSEWSNGRRAPMILRTDIPEGDWRIETDVLLKDTITWDAYHVGLAVTYNQGDDTDVSGDEYLFGFHSDDLRVELTGQSAFGILDYHEFTDEYDWIDEMLFQDKITAKIAVTRRDGELIFSALLPGSSWQLVGPPITETRQATRVGIFAKNWGSENFNIAEYDYFTLQTLDIFTDVVAWELY